MAALLAKKKKKKNSAELHQGNESTQASNASRLRRGLIISSRPIQETANSAAVDNRLIG
jgi:hypothetical protein